MLTPSKTAIPPRTPMQAAGTTTTPVIMHVAPPPPIPRLGGTTNGYHPWTGGEPTNATFTATRQVLPRSAHCHHFHDPTEAHKQSKQQPQIRTQRSGSQEMRKLSPLRSWLNLFWIMWSFAAWIRNSSFLIHKTHRACVTSYETMQSLPQQQW